MSDRETKPDIGFITHNTLPADFDADLVESLEREGVSVRSVQISSGPFAGIELYVPAAAMLFVATAYFTGFVQKAGEDHYELLKDSAKKLWSRASALRMKAVGSTGKVSQTPFSLAYAIMGEVSDGNNFKFVVRVELDEAEAESGISAFLDLLRNIHAGTISDDDFNALLTYRAVGGTTIVTFDPKLRRIVPVDAFGRPTAT